MNFALIAAADQKNGIGKNNTLVWNLKEDMKHFSSTTTQVTDPYKKNVVIMGSNTWLSLPEKHRPLKNRVNVVLSRNADFQLPEGVILASSIDDAIAKIEARSDVEKAFIIGGASVYAQAIKHPKCKTIYLTRLGQSFDCDTFFPEIDPGLFKLVDESEPRSENGIEFKFLRYERG